MRAAVVFIALVSLACSDLSYDEASTRQAIVGGQLNPGDAAVCAIRGHVGSSWYLCTGTLVAPDLVVTAAHCVDGKDRIEVVFGGDVADPILDIAASSWTIHPEYSDTHSNLLNRHFDVAVVRLPDPVQVAPKKLGNAANINVGDEIRHVGYGETSSGAYDSGLKQHVSSELKSKDTHWLIAGDQWANTCVGDSGGPQFAWIDGEEKLVGITSFGQAPPSGTLCRADSVATRIDSLWPFLQQHLP